MFNNGRDSIRPWSSVDILDIHLPQTGHNQLTGFSAKLLWRYQAKNKTDFYSTFLSGAQILPGGHLLITEGQKGRIIEIDSNKNIIWEYINPHNGTGSRGYGQGHKKKNYVYRATWYSADSPEIRKLFQFSSIPQR